MNRENLERGYRVAVSIFVFAILAAQAATLPVTASGRTIIRSKLFPILEYPMYAIAHYEGDRVTGTWILEGVYPDGRTLNITQENLRLSTWDFIRVVQHAVRKLPGSQDRLVGLIRSRLPDGRIIREVRIKNYPIKVTRHGPQPMPSEVVMKVSIQPAPGSHP